MRFLAQIQNYSVANVLISNHVMQHQTQTVTFNKRYTPIGKTLHNLNIFDILYTYDNKMPANQLI